MKNMRSPLFASRKACLMLVLFSAFAAVSFPQARRVLSGVVVTPQFELVPKVSITIDSQQGQLTTITNAEGEFRIEVPAGPLSVKVRDKNLLPIDMAFSDNDRLNNLRWTVTYIIPPVSEQVTIEARALTPEIELRNEAVYRNSLFARDDQLVHTLNAGINAGQHEGGGKSLEIRRFGFNTDHGGVNGGVKILVDNVQQNQVTQGHGQGYLGSLKSISPELVQDVTVINGPFSPVHGDFSGLGVVQINLRESMPDVFTARLQGGAFNTARGFFALSPSWKKIDSFIAFEPSYTDGPFLSPLRYRRDNVTGNLTYKFSDKSSIGVKLNFGSNNFFSSGQIPLDLVNAGQLDRFGAVDRDNGGKVQLGTIGVNFRKEWSSGAAFKADAFVGRSLFDLFSNFTFFLTDPIYGDEIQQHDSRLQEGANLQYIVPYKLGAGTSVLTVGGSVYFNQINVGLYPSIGRDPGRKFLPENIDNPNVLVTKATANIGNYAGYVQNSFVFAGGHFRVDAGLRFDQFNFAVRGFELGGRDSGNGPCNSDFADPVNAANPCALILDGSDSAGKFQPKLAIALTPSDDLPLTLYFNYGRGISSQDARGIVRNPDAPKISTTDFYQAGTSLNYRRLSFVFSTFLIDRSNEQVYIPDDGSIELAGRSRSYGIELRNSFRLNRHVSLNAGITQVLKAYYPGEFTPDGRRVIVDSAPHTVANGAVVIDEIRGFNFTLNWRHISKYRLDGEDPSVTAAGHDVVDLFVSKRLKKWVSVNLSIDNLLNKRYYETQNYFESRVHPGYDSPAASRIHATPGFPFAVTAGLTFTLGGKR